MYSYFHSSNNLRPGGTGQSAARILSRLLRPYLFKSVLFGLIAREVIRIQVLVRLIVRLSVQLCCTQKAFTIDTQAWRKHSDKQTQQRELIAQTAYLSSMSA